MTRGTLVTALAVAVATAACKPAPPGPQKTGPAVAQGEGLLITADEFKARLDEQSPFIRQRYAALDRKKEFLDNLVRFELLARAAEKEGLATDPDVLLTTRKIMVQKLVQKKFAEGDPSKEIPEADAQKYYDAHRDEFVKPAKVRLAGILVSAGEKGAPASARAAKLLAQLKASMKKNPQALQAMAREVSDDPVSKGAGGDLGFKSKEELAKQGGPAFADAVFALKEGAPATVDSTQGVWIIQLIGRQDEVVRTFDQMKGQIQARLAREKRTKEFDEYVKRLREEARVQVVEAELEKVPVSGGPGPGPGAPGGMMGAGPMGGPMGGPHGGMPPAAPVAAPPRPAAPPPAPPPAPAQK